MSKEIIISEKILDNDKVKIQTIKRIGMNGINRYRNRIVFPSLPDEELLNRYNKIKPMFVTDNIYYYLANFNIDLIRSNLPLEIYRFNVQDEVNMEKLEELDVFPCYHAYNHYGVFKPSIAEVLEQMPDDLLEETCAFCIPETATILNDLESRTSLMRAICHKSDIKVMCLKK